MAKSPVRKSPPAIKKTLDALAKRIKALEDQSFAQQLLIDDLESKLEQAEKSIKDVRDNPFHVPYTSTPVPTPAPLHPGYVTHHTCVGGQSDFWTGAVHCTISGALMYSLSWTVTSTSDGTSLCLTDPAGADTEPVLDLDISWVIPDDLAKKD